MVERERPFSTNGFLTAKDREFLRGEGSYSKSEIRSRRRHIRNRLAAAFADFATVWGGFPLEDTLSALEPMIDIYARDIDYNSDSKKYAKGAMMIFGLQAFVKIAMHALGDEILEDEIETALFEYGIWELAIEENVYSPGLSVSVSIDADSGEENDWISIDELESKMDQDRFSVTPEQYSALLAAGVIDTDEVRDNYLSEN